MATTTSYHCLWIVKQTRWPVLRMCGQKPGLKPNQYQKTQSDIYLENRLVHWKLLEVYFPRHFIFVLHKSLVDPTVTRAFHKYCTYTSHSEKKSLCQRHCDLAQPSPLCLTFKLWLVPLKSDLQPKWESSNYFMPFFFPLAAFWYPTVTFLVFLLRKGTRKDFSEQRLKRKKYLNNYHSN